MLKHIAAASVAVAVVGYAVPSIADSNPVNTTADSAPTQPMNALPSTAAPAEAGKTPEMSQPGSATQVTPLGTQTVQNPTETPAPDTTTPASPDATETAPASTPITPNSTETAPATTPGSTETAPTSTPTTIPTTPDATTPAPDTTTPASPAPTTPVPTTPAPATETPKPTGESSSTGARTMVLEKETITGVKEVALPTPPVTPAYFTLPITLQVAKEASITSDTPITDKLAKDLPNWGAAISACLRDKPAFVRVVDDEQVPFVVGEGEGKVRLNANNKPVCTASL